MAVLTTLPRDPLLDLEPWVGQRQASFRFHVTDALTDRNMGEIRPIRAGASLSHDTQRTIKRQLKIALGVADTAAINPIRERISVSMVFPNGATYPLGRYMFTDASDTVYTSGNLGTETLNDEMYLVDQQIRRGINGLGTAVTQTIGKTLAGLPVKYQIDPSPFGSTQSWAVGSNRGQILEALAVTGDFFSPWFNNENVLRFIRTFNAAKQICDFDFDAGNKVLRSDIVQTSDLLTSPNVILAISNANSDINESVVGVARIPDSAPNSVVNRGFEITETFTLQMADAQQAAAVAQGLAERQTIFETVELTTAPDPRHDSYNVIRWQGVNWLELGWTMALEEGARMNHLLRKAYR